MRFIGITGGAKDLMEPGGACYEGIISMFQEAGIEKTVFLNEDGSLHRLNLAKVLFTEKDLREKLNAYVHPAVKKEVLRRAELAKQNHVEWLFVEAALLIEEHYDEICDELWYIYASLEVRRNRLKESRGYTDQKIDSIVASQKSEDTFREYCKVWINNDGDFAVTKDEIERAMQRL